uniref:Single-pass membrane and coiled-coil domain-containing protein 4 n=1 Tax=Ciona intestinalis TaxID=7719 RepID=H2XLQ4_CIOIN
MRTLKKSWNAKESSKSKAERRKSNKEAYNNFYKIVVPFLAILISFIVLFVYVSTQPVKN